MFRFRPFLCSSRSVAGVVSLFLISCVLLGCAGLSSQKSASLAVSSSSFNFKTVPIGQTVNLPLTVSNRGTAPVQITALKISNDRFSVSGPSLPRTILPNNILNYSVSFTPIASGSVAATLSFVSNAANPPPPIPLTGSGAKVFADLAITPSSINFGDLTLKNKSTQNVTLQNTSDVNLTIQGVAVAGAGFGYADLSAGLSLAPNQKTTFQVWFSPAVAGQSAATMSFLSPNLASPGTLSLRGDGVTTPTTPRPPSTPAPAAQHVVHLTWNASSSSVIGYLVYRSEVPGSSYSALFGTAINQLSYSDATVSSGTTYSYVVTAVDSMGRQSSDSNQVTVAVP